MSEVRMSPSMTLPQQKALLMSLKPGDTCIVESGVYTGGLNVQECPNGLPLLPITVKAEFAGKVFIQGSTSQGWTLAKCNWWVIEGLTWQQNTAVGLKLSVCNNVTVRNCVFRENGTGMITGTATDVTVDSCEAYGNFNEWGIYFSNGSSRFTVKNSAMYRNRKGGLQANAAPNPMTGGLVENCRIWSNNAASLNGADPITAAINILSAKDVVVRNCQIYGNWGQGVSISATTGCTVEGCLIAFAPGTGKRCVNSSNGSDLSNKAVSNLFIMGGPLPPIDGVITQLNNAQSFMPPTPSPEPSPIP